MAHLLITIDTEEDEWGQYNAPRYQARNIGRLNEIQELFARFGVTPTYLVSYQVACNEEAVRVLDRLAGSNQCEIGAHCHPWNTPPFRGPSDDAHSMLSNLDSDTQFEKIAALRDLLHGQFRRAPVSFRAGRCGFNESVGENLLRLGFRVDTSVTPLMSWTAYGGPDFSEQYPEAFWLDLTPSTTDRLLEVPCTVGFLQRDPDRAYRMLRAIRSSRLLRLLRVHGLLDRFGMLNQVWLCPEKSSAEEMIALTRMLLREGRTLLNVMFHSVSLEPGLSPFVRTEDDRIRFLDRLRSYLEFCRAEGLTPVCLDSLPFAATDSAPVRPLHTGDRQVLRGQVG